MRVGSAPVEQAALQALTRPHTALAPVPAAPRPAEPEMRRLAKEVRLVGRDRVDQVDAFLLEAASIEQESAIVIHAGEAGAARSRRRSRPSTMVILFGGILMPL